MTMTAIRPAATVVLLRDRANGLEVLMLRRHTALDFAAGMWVFPGGRLDDADYGDDTGDVMAAARRAAVRETREEAGLIVREDALRYFSHWTTPEGEVKRYATWFFIAAIDTADEVQVDGVEIDLHRWVRPADALLAYRNRTIEMLPPTFITLTELATCQTAADALVMYRSRPILEILPKFVHSAQGPCVLYQGDAGYVAADPSQPGARNRCWLREDGWHYECDLSRAG
jgi:8-oxo-dGTP pyrophosphatase MutT (NUDIX family)